MSRNDLHLQYSHTFINSISGLHLPTFRPQAGILSEKNPLFSLFFYRKTKLPNFTLPLNRSRSTQGYHFTNFVELESSMMHAKLQDHRTSGSGEEDF